MVAQAASLERQSVPTVVIGAGPSGLAVAACLARRGQSFVLVDAADKVGASWHNHYERLHLHTARATSGLPFLPMPQDWPTYPSRAQIAHYLQRYADAMGLAPKLGTRVTRARREGTTWLVDSEPGPGWACQNLVVATGYNAVPYRAHWPGLETFAGPVIHSADYKNGKNLSHQRVLVVGSGNSGAEIAIDLWEHDARPAMSIRGPVHVVPRDFMGIPSQRMTLMMSRLPARVADRLSAPLRAKFVGDLSPWGIHAPAEGPLETLEKRGRVPLVDVGTVALVKQGAIKVFPDIRQVDRSDVVFVDGRRQGFDAIILATGYRAGLERWIDGVQAALDARGLPRVHGAEAIGGLYFCGYRNPTTGALRESGIEGLRVAEHIARKVTA